MKKKYKLTEEFIEIEGTCRMFCGGIMKIFNLIVTLVLISSMLQGCALLQTRLPLDQAGEAYATPNVQELYEIHGFDNVPFNSAIQNKDGTIDIK